MAHRIQRFENKPWDYPGLEDSDDQLIEPEKTEWHQCQPVHLPPPSYKHVPDRSNASVFLEDVEDTGKSIGGALAGVLKRHNSNDDSSSSSSSDNEDQKLGKKIRITLPSQVAMFAAGAFAVTGTSRLLRNQLDLRRRNAIEANKREDHQAIVANKFKCAEADLNYRGTRGANADLLNDKKENHHFLLRQREINSQTNIARMEARVTAQANMLQAQVRLHDNDHKSQLELHKINAQQAETRLNTNARIFENSQQLTSQCLESYEKVMMDAAEKRLEQSAQGMEFVLRTQQQVFSFAKDVIELQQQQVQFRFEPRKKENLCLKGVTVHQLLTNRPNPEGINRIQFAFKNVIKLHKAGLKKTEAKIDDITMFKRASLNAEIRGLSSLEVSDFIFESLSKFPSNEKEAALDRLFAMYINLTNPNNEESNGCNILY